MRLLLSILISFQLIFAYPAFAVEIKIKAGSRNRLNLRNEDKYKQFKTDFTIPAGTVLEIPDVIDDKSIIIKDSNGDVDENATLNNWLRIGERRYEKVTNNGRAINDNFFKVRIKSFPKYYTNLYPDAAEKYKNHTGYVALSNFVRSGKIELLSTEETTIRDLEAQNDQKANASKLAAQRQEEEIQEKLQIPEATVCKEPGCIDPTPEMPKQISDLKHELAKYLEHSEKEAKKDVDNHSFASIEKNFDNPDNCYGLKFDDFKKFLITKAKEKHIPAEVMLGILTQESAGKCGAAGDLKEGGHASLGLFQINTKTASDYGVCPLSSPLKCRCTAEQKTKLRSGITLEQMDQATDLKCLENPAYNTELSLDILISKYKRVNSGKLPPEKEKVSEYNDNEKDLMRKALAAYNGGEGYVYSAYDDMKLLADKLGIKVDTDNWEQRRIFFFRQGLEERSELYRNNPAKYRRDLERTYINVSYVEAIMGRNSKEQDYKDYAAKWSDILYKN